jgi:hypothetical protein
MVTVTIDEAYAFDMLSILQVKLNESIDENKRKSIEENYRILSNDLQKQIGTDKFQSVIKSYLYSELVIKNKEIFDLVDITKTIDGPPHDLWKENYNRYLAKQALQKEFFENEILETKLDE